MADDATATLPETDTTEPSIDIGAAVDQISADLFPQTDKETTDTTPQETVAKAVADSSSNGTPTKIVPPLPTVRPAPKSWAKETHPLWEKADPKVQEYIEKREKDFLEGTRQYTNAAQYAKSIQDVINPYQPLLQSKGLEAPAVINDLLGTYTRLTQGTMEQRQAALLQVAKNLQIAMPTNGAEAPPQTDPRLQTIEQQLQELRDAQTAQQRAALQAAQQKASMDVEAFVNDVDKDGKPTHALFDDCYEDIVKLLKAGDSLQEAYDKAVWANPVTREQQKQSYFQTESEKAKERARLDALPKQKARGVNVKSQSTQRSPTDPLGSMDDTLRSTLRDIKERTTH